jgi:hypothetical protein
MISVTTIAAAAPPFTFVDVGLLEESDLALIEGELQARPVVAGVLNIKPVIGGRLTFEAVIGGVLENHP